MKNKKILIGVLALFFLFFTLSSAQTRTGGLTGWVADEEGTPLPGVEIVISSPSLIAPQLAGITNERGFLRFAYLPPGTYEVTANLDGFASTTQEGIIIKLGLTTDIKVQMKLAKLEEEVTVTASAPLVATEDTKLSTNVKYEELRHLPVARNLASALELAPAISRGQPGRQVILAGLGGGMRENTYSVDGVQVTDPGCAYEPVASQPMDAYEEIQVEIGGHEAESGNAGGAMMNVVTKSGGNDFHGEVSFYLKNRNLQSTNHEGTGLSAPSEETVHSYDTNVSLGGPIIKDKIWFFLSGGYLSSKKNIVGFPEETPNTRYMPLAKLTFQPNIKHRFSLSYTYNRDSYPYMFANRFREPDACFNTTYQGHIALINWLYTISPNTISEIRGAYLVRPTNYLSRGQDVVINDVGTGMRMNSLNDCLQKRIRTTIVASITHYLDGFVGDHKFKGGIEYEKGQSQNKIDYYPDQYGMTHYSLWNGAPYMSRRADPAKSEWQIINYYQYSGYLQDTWRISRFISANIGFRFTHVDAQVPVQGPISDKIDVSDWTTVEPRIGLGIDPFGDGKTGVKLNISRYNMMMWTWFYSLNPNQQTTYYYSNPAPGVFNYMYSTSPARYEINPDMKRPFVDELFFSIDRVIGKNWAAKATVVYRRYRNFVTIEDPGRTPDWYDPIEVTNPVTNGPMTVYNLRAGAPEPSTYYTNNEAAKRDYRAVILEISRRLSDNFQFRLSYTWSEAKGTAAQVGMGLQAGGNWSNPNALINNSGFLDLDRKHLIKFQGIYYAPFGFILGVNYLGSSGLPYTGYFNVALNQGAESINGEPLGSRRNPFANYVDIKLEKDLSISKVRLSLFIDVYNLLNSNTTISTYSRYGSPLYLKTTNIQAARLFQIGLRVTF